MVDVPAIIYAAEFDHDGRRVFVAKLYSLPAEALGAVANQKLIAEAMASMMPTNEPNRFLISRSFFIYGKGLSYGFYEIRSR